jgi:hypothetical protein
MKDKVRTSSLPKVVPFQNNFHQHQYSPLPSQPTQAHLPKRDRLRDCGIPPPLQAAQGSRHHLKGENPQTYHQPLFLSRNLRTLIVITYPNCLPQVLEVQVLCAFVVLQQIQLSTTMVLALPRLALSLLTPPTLPQGSRSSHFKSLLDNLFGPHDLESMQQKMQPILSIKFDNIQFHYTYQQNAPSYKLKYNIINFDS